MRFSDQFTNRVTLGEDGVYRWFAEVDLKKDHYLQNLMLRIMLIIGGSVGGLMVLMMVSMQRYEFIWIPVAICAFVVVLGLIIFRIYRAMLHDVYPIAYEMNENAVMMVKSPDEQKLMRSMAVLSAASAFITGNTAQGLTQSAACEAAADPCLIQLRKGRGIAEYPKNHMLRVKMFFNFNTIWVPAEDYDMVLRFLQEHVGRRS